MKKIISIDRDISFKTMIKEITSICLDHTLKFVSNSSVEGDLIVSGTYKMTEASRLEEDFEYKIPVSISTTLNFVLDTAEVEIDDFSYEVVGDDTLSVKIDILLAGVEEVIVEKEEVRECDEEEEKEEVRECDGEEEKEEVRALKEVDEETTLVNNDLEVLEDKQEVVEEVEDDKDKDNKTINSLFMSLTEEDETFSTYLVYIMRKNDSIEKVLDMYGITREELSNYNDLDSVEVGSKLIIPCSNE